jgi:hypothetical protein
MGRPGKVTHHLAKMAHLQMQVRIVSLQAARGFIGLLCLLKQARVLGHVPLLHPQTEMPRHGGTGLGIKVGGLGEILRIAGAVGRCHQPGRRADKGDDVMVEHPHRAQRLGQGPRARHRVGHRGAPGAPVIHAQMFGIAVKLKLGGGQRAMQGLVFQACVAAKVARHLGWHGRVGRCALAGRILIAGAGLDGPCLRRNLPRLDQRVFQKPAKDLVFLGIGCLIVSRHGHPH